MKILYIPGMYPFCYYFRGYMPGVYSDQMVVKDFLTLKKESPEGPIIDQARRADTVVFQRPYDEQSLNLMRLLKRMGKKVIFENDDTYLIGKGVHLDQIKGAKAQEVVKYFDKNIKEALKIADGAIASTKILADEFAQINPNVAVLKNCIDPLDEYPCKKNDTGKFRIGFIGSVTTNGDYSHIKDQIRKLDERGDVTIVILGVKRANGQLYVDEQEDFQFWNSLKNIEWHAYVPVTDYMLKLASFALDLAVIPREESYFNKCKSNLKFLEMSLLKIPVIAQGFLTKDGPYDSPKDKKYMTVIYDNGTWYDTIIKIKENYELFSNKAVQAHDYVLKNYNIKNYAQQWTKTIKKLCK